MRVNQLVLLQQKIKEVERECKYLAVYELENVRREDLNALLLIEIAATALKMQGCVEKLEEFKSGLIK